MEYISKCINKQFFQFLICIPIYTFINIVKQLTWNHLVNTYNIQTFDIWTGWRLINISANGLVHQKIVSIIINSIHLLLKPQWSYKLVKIIWEVFSISTVQLHKTLWLKLECRNAPTKPNYCTIALCL